MKDMRHNSDRESAWAFTLIEMLLVMAIILIMASMVIGLGVYANQRSKVNQALRDMAAIQNALAGYYKEFGQYPPQDSARPCADQFGDPHPWQAGDYGDPEPPGILDEMNRSSWSNPPSRGALMRYIQYNLTEFPGIDVAQKWQHHVKNLKYYDYSSGTFTQLESGFRVTYAHCGDQIVDPWFIQRAAAGNEYSGYWYECKPPYQQYRLWCVRVNMSATNEFVYATTWTNAASWDY